MSRMRAFVDNLRLALRHVRGNPLRSMLTLLGIVIGVATVVTMMALLEGLRVKVNRDLVAAGRQRLPRRQVAAGHSLRRQPHDWDKHRAAAGADPR